MFKKYLKQRQKVMKYFSQHVEYNSFVHMMGGIGIGILITYPLVGEHPIRWAVVFLSVSILAHLYPLLVK
jgi:hypothetical protein